MNADQALAGVQRSAKRRKDAAALRTTATEDLRRYCLEAQKAGVPISEIAREADLSRQGVYDLLGAQP